TDQANRLATPYIKIDIFQDVNAPSSPAQRQVDAGERNDRACTPRPRGILHVESLIRFASGGMRTSVISARPAQRPYPRNRGTPVRVASPDRFIGRGSRAAPAHRRAWRFPYSGARIACG